VKTRATATAPLDARARAQLGFDALYDEQRRAIELSVAGRDVLVVMPTGSHWRATSARPR